MGEWSKRVGEIGEEIVGEFFSLIGWSDAQRNLTLPCSNGIRHKSSESARKTHGIDYLFSYESQLANRTLDHLVISVKYTADPYPSNPSSTFKNHFLDLAKSLECFKKSEIRQLANRNFSGVDNARNIGVLFWLSDDETGYSDAIERIASVREVDDYNYGTIFVVDNKRISFIYDTIKSLNLNYPRSEITFFYQNTGKNYNHSNREASGTILPVEFINSGILPIKITHEDSKVTFVISTIDDFHIDRLKKLLGLAHEITLTLSTDILILFPDYKKLRHENIVQEAKTSFKDKNFTKKIKVASFNSNFRGLTDEK